MSETLDVAPGQIIVVKDHPRPGENAQCMVLYPISASMLEVIPYDGTVLIGRIGGGIPASDILEVLMRLSDDEYTRLIVLAGVGKEATARDIYKRPAISYEVSS